MALKEEKVLVTSGKKKASVRKETHAVSGMRVTIVHKNQTTNAATPSEPSLSRGRRVSRKRSIRGKGNRGSILRQPCRYYLKGTCTRSPCEYWHPPECQFHKAEAGCKARDKCLFPHHKVDEQPNKKPKKGYYSHKRRESDDKNAVKIVSQMGCASHDAEALFSRSGKQSRGNPMQKVLGLIRKVRFTQSTLRQASIQERKGPSHGKIQVKHLHQGSPYAMKFEDRSHEETERQQRCKEKDKTTFYSPAEEWVLPAASTKEPEDREFVVDSGASMHMVSKRDLDSAELETMRTSRSPTTVMTANGEVQTRDEATVYVKELDLFVTVMLLEETPAVLSLGKLCEDHRYTYHWTSGQKPHLTKKGK